MHSCPASRPIAHQGRKKNFANGRIIKGDSDHVSGTVHTITCFELLLNGRRWVLLWQARKDAHLIHTSTLRVGIIPLTSCVIGFSIPVVKFPSSGLSFFGCCFDATSPGDRVKRFATHSVAVRRKIRKQNNSENTLRFVYSNRIEFHLKFHFSGFRTTV